MTIKIDTGNTLHTSTDGVVFNPHLVSTDRDELTGPVSAIVQIEPTTYRSPNTRGAPAVPAMSINVLNWRGRTGGN